MDLLTLDNLYKMIRKIRKFFIRHDRKIKRIFSQVIVLVIPFLSENLMNGIVISLALIYITNALKNK